MRRALLAWIAVATATAIRVFTPAQALPLLVVAIVAGAGVLALVRGQRLSTRVAAILLLLVAMVDGATLWRLHTLATSYDRLAAEHRKNDVDRVQGRINAIQVELDSAAAAVGNRLGDPRTAQRPALFALLNDALPDEAVDPGRGARILDPSGAPIAWWGEDLRATGNHTYQFDATSLYIVKTRPAASGYVVQTFARIPNGPTGQPLVHPRDPWILSSIFHGGFLRQDPRAERHVIDRRNDATLYIDLLPRARADVFERTRDDGRNVSSLLIAVGALILLALLWREYELSHGGERHAGWQPVLRPARLPAAPSFAAAAAALILMARAALLGIRVADDPLRIFHFDVFASRMLWIFSKSPFDLLATAAALAAILAVTAHLHRRLPVYVRSALAMAAAYGFVALARNLVDNSRISALPDHIVPVSAVQAVLLAALLLFGFAVLQIAEHDAPRKQALLSAAIFAAAALTIASLLNHTSAATAFLWCAGGALAAIVVCAVAHEHWLRLFAFALLIVAIVWGPTQSFERASASRFISGTYAPLVAGESSQLRTMIEDTLHNEFTRTDLSTILPDDYRHMNLDDLAYALWLRSDLSKWRVPAVITITDEFTRATISRFGVGLPQFTERNAIVGREVLQVGSVTRVLMHHDFDVTAWGTTIALGSVHVVNPAEPGAMTSADAYRDFFEANSDDLTTGLHAQPVPAVFDREGNSHGATVRLPQNPARYFAALKPGRGYWVEGTNGISRIYLMRGDNALYAFPLQIPTAAQQIRRAGGVAIWGIAGVVLLLMARSLPNVLQLVRRRPRTLDFRTRTSLYFAAVVILPLLLFTLFVRAYLAGRLEAEYYDRGQTALNAAQRVIEDYLASSKAARPEQVLDDEVLAWLARVVGHDLHLYRDEQVVASSRRDLFAAHIEAQNLPGDVYSSIVLRGDQMYRDQRDTGPAQFVEIYSPINLGSRQSYTLALPFIVQGRQIETQVNDLATTIYMMLVFIALAAVAVAFRIAGTMTRPVQGLVAGARGIARGDFDVAIRVPHDPDLGLLVTTFRDMAQSIRRQQEELRHERDRLQTLLENIAAAVVVLDGSMHVAATNLAARKLLGLAEHSDEFFKPRFDELREFLAHHRNRRAESEEIEISVDGNLRTYRVSIVPLPDSEEEMLIAEDVTEILRSNRLEAWGEMARQVAHEIKNPLTPIQLTAEHLRAVAERNDPNLPAVVRRAVDNILRQVVTLRETSREFSDYASLRQVQRKPLNLQRLLKDIAADYVATGERGIDFRAEISPSTPENYSGDARLLRGAIANLVENALQAAPGGRVRLCSSAVDSKVVIRVDDTGPGVEPELLPKIFDPYFSTKSSGTGLGLAIARKAIEEHGGHVHAENLNPGLRVEIELPLGKDLGLRT